MRNNTAIFIPVKGFLIMPLLILCLALTPRPATAQYDATAPGALSRAELAQMLAPIALYPDVLLSQILMASTYPIEVIEAERWVRSNPGLQGDALDAALLDTNWDPSVQALCHFPAILTVMSERIGETTNLGNAFLAQQQEVMDTVQELRAQAYAQGNLNTTEQQRVVVDNRTIVIEPASPSVVYVPYYDPLYVYGPWWYPAYLPYYWGPPRVTLGFGISFWPGIYFGFSFGNWCYFDWPRHSVYVDVHKRPRYARHDRWHDRWHDQSGSWHHAPVHRRGVAYRDKDTAREYGQVHRRSGELWRDTRGFPERDGREDGRDRPAIGRPGVGGNGRADEDRGRIERRRPEVQYDGRERQRREEPARDLRQRPANQRDEQQRERVIRVQPTRQSDREEPGRDVRQRPAGEREEQQRERVMREPSVRQPEREARPARDRERVEQQRSRDNIFNQVEDGWRERLSSERGRSSRQDRGGDGRDRGRSGGYNRGGSDSRGSHNRR